MNHTRVSETLKGDLQIVAWNGNGLPNKFEELREFLVYHKADILLLNETHLSPSKRVRQPNYALYRNDRQVRNNSARAKGGTAIAVKMSIRHYRVPLPLLSHLEATAVELPGVQGGLLLESAYNPPRQGPLVDDLAVIFAAHNKVILVGDLNSKHPTWGSRLLPLAAGGYTGLSPLTISELLAQPNPLTVPC